LRNHIHRGIKQFHERSGSWFSYNETKIAQGRDAAKQVILDNPELAEELEGLIFAELRKDK
jgi:recombination protein RecA